MGQNLGFVNPLYPSKHFSEKEILKMPHRKSVSEKCLTEKVLYILSVSFLSSLFYGRLVHL